MLRFTRNAVLLSALVLSGTAAVGWAQQPFFVSTNDTVSVIAGSSLYVDGDFILGAGSRVRNRGTILFTQQWDGSAGGRYIWDRLPTPNDSLIVLAVYGASTMQSAGDSIGILALNAAQPQMPFAGTATVLQTLHFENGLWNTQPGSTLRIGPRAGTSGDRFDRFVNGPLVTVKNPSSFDGDRFYPVGKDTVYRPLALFGTTVAGGSNEIRVEQFNANPVATGTPGQRFQRLSTTRYARIDIEAGAAGPNVEVRENYGPRDNRVASELPFLRHGLRSQISPAGNYDTLLTIARSGSVAGGRLRSRIPALSPAFPNYVVIGINKLDAGTLAFTPPTINVGDTSRGEITTADVGPDITRNIERSVNLGPFAAFGTVGGNVLGFNSDTIFRPTRFQVIATAGPNFEPDTTNIAEPILNPFVTLDLQVLLQGPYQSPGIMVQAGDVPFQPGFPTYEAFLRNYFRTRSTADSLMYPNFGSNTFDVPTGAIDVVSLELRTGLAAATLVPGSRKLAWLMPDGSLRDFRTGSANHPVMHFNAGPGSYYIVMRHRNHLPMMSSVPVLFAPITNNRASFDMRVIANVYSPFPSFQRGGFVFGADGRIAAFLGNVASRPGEFVQHVNAFDFFTVFQDGSLALPGYRITDVNLDGLANATDYQIVQINNDRLYFTTVPE